MLRLGWYISNLQTRLHFLPFHFENHKAQFGPYGFYFPQVPKYRSTFPHHICPPPNYSLIKTSGYSAFCKNFKEALGEDSPTLAFMVTDCPATCWAVMFHQNNFYEKADFLGNYSPFIDQL